MQQSGLFSALIGLYKTGIPVTSLELRFGKVLRNIIQSETECFIPEIFNQAYKRHCLNLNASSASSSVSNVTLIYSGTLNLRA